MVKIRRKEPTYGDISRGFVTDDIVWYLEYYTDEGHAADIFVNSRVDMCRDTLYYKIYTRGNRKLALVVFVLYHYYHTGTLPDIRVHGSYNDMF